MAIPDFVLRLREKIGHDLLWLPGVAVVVVDDDGRVLLGRRSDNGRWAAVSGIPEPGEQPADTAVRECVEETGVRPDVLAVVDVSAGKPMILANRDTCVYMTVTFVARADAAQAARARVADDESTEVGWFAPDALPSPLNPSSRRRIEAALAWLDDPTRPARFVDASA